MRTIILSLEGVNLRSGFIVREMSIYYLHDWSFRHYFFETPDNLSLTEDDRQTARFYRDMMGGIDLDRYIDGSIPYINLDYILLQHSSYSIYVVGNVSYNFLRDKLPSHSKITDIRNITTFVYPRTLETAGCGVHHEPRYCSLAKLKFVIDFCTENF